MNVEQGIERRLTDFYASEGAMRAPDRVLMASLSTIETTQQRRVYGVPWRLPRMNTYARLAVAGAAVIAVVAVGLYFLAGNQPAIGGPPPPSPSPTPSPTASPTPSATASPAAELTQRFTSTLYGLSVSYPAGWAARVAVTPMRPGDAPTFEGGRLDLMYDPTLTDHLWVGTYSQPLTGVTGSDWMTARLAGWGCADSVDVIIDGEAGRLGNGCEANVAVAAAQGRGYVALLYSSGDNPQLPTVYDDAWFRDLLATVDLNPAAAASPSRSPSSSP